jgi:uncharacterized DUF497 family protein
VSIAHLTEVEGFEWDEGNARKNVKHGVSQDEAEQVFLNEPVLVLEDWKHSGIETRFHALGKSNAGRMLHVTFTLRASATRIRVISARAMSRREKVVYGQASEAHS